MAKSTEINVRTGELDPDVSNQVARILQEDHGVYGLRMTSEDQSEQTVDVDLLIGTNDRTNELSFSYSDENGQKVTERSIRSLNNIRGALSRFAISNLVIPLSEQSSRGDFTELLNYGNTKPNLEADPSIWVVGNPFVARLCRTYPQYGNLVRYLCNERGLFLKVGNYSTQRAYWNSSLNGGLPVYKKADPVHEGTFMLHDMLHFVPIDPLLGSGELEDKHRSTYIAHRMLSEATTLVLADMVGIADSGIEANGYDTSKRKIFPLYNSMCKAIGGSRPDIDKLLAANAYFCFTGDPEGFQILGATKDSAENYKIKYESIFREDFMWNLANFESMLRERAENPDIAEYYSWLESKPFICPTLESYTQRIDPSGEGVDISTMLSLFRGDYTRAMGYSMPIDNTARTKLAYEKYLAGQRIIFKRFPDVDEMADYLSRFDETYDSLQTSSKLEDVNMHGSTASNIVDSYLDRLEAKGQLLPHELALYRFSAPTYPIRFVNYERHRVQSNLTESMKAFVDINQNQLNRLLEAVSS